MRLTRGQLAVLVVAAVLGAATFALVDFEPRVEGDFFFSTGDPQLRETQRVEELFGAVPQVLVEVRSRGTFRRDTLVRLRDLSDALGAVPGVTTVRSVTHGPMETDEILERDPAKIRKKLLASPWWRSLLLSPDGEATYVVLLLSEDDPAPAVQGIDRVLRRFEAPGFELAASGVPYVAEHVREELSHDLLRFSIAAFIAFTVLISLLFRSFSVTIGTITAALGACFATFLVREAFGMSVGILTPNLWTIAFVLTLSHVVYLTASYRRLARERGEEEALREAVRLAGPPSVWSLVANLLGFLSLVFVDAKPLREFGISGAIAAAAALACSYGMYPPFLRAGRLPRGEPGALTVRLERFFTRPHLWIAVAFVLCALALAPFSRRVDTDPRLPTYFAEQGTIRRGLEAIDNSGGSSPLEMVVRDAGGGTLRGDKAFERLLALQRDLERHEDVGAVVSVALLMAETDRHWLSFLLSWEKRFKRLESPKHERIGRSFLTEDRRLGRFILRMREHARDGPRAEVIGEIQGLARRHGFEPVLTGGLYRLQGELSELVRRSVVRGVGGLVVMFFIISLLTSRSLRVSLAMAACVALVPLALYGCIGLLEVPLDVISAPAANVALPLGIDEMIHIAYALRRSRRGRHTDREAWRRALAELWLPTFVSALVVAAGFSLFLLSPFPPTQRLGMLVCIGALLTDVAVLVVLPALALIGRRGQGAIGQ